MDEKAFKVTLRPLVGRESNSKILQVEMIVMARDIEVASDEAAMYFPFHYVDEVYETQFSRTS